MASGADRISDLPEGVLHHILSLLPAQDAVRTCVLAQSWRNRWRSAPAVRFVCSTNTTAGINVFAAFVEGLLRVRRGGPPLDSCDFDLHVDLEDDDFDLEVEGNKWFRSVLELKVRKVRFRVSTGHDNPFAPNFWSLSRVSHLTSLELTGIEHHQRCSFCGCPTLVSLKVEASHLNWMEMQSPSLKRLSIKNCFDHSDGRIMMCFPSLVSFEFINNSGRAPMLEAMPYLETAKVQFNHDFDDRCTNGRLDDCGDATCPGCSYYDDGCDDLGSVLLHGLAEAKYLNLSAYPEMYVFNRDLKWCPAFNKLKTLVLSKWFLSTDLSALIWFLNHAPLLEKLTLEIPKPRKTLMKTEGSYNPFEKSIAPSHLQSVEIISKDVDGIVFKVLKVLNANGIPLGKIRIQCAGYDFVCTNINSM